jgi:ankyrin repeat protein
VAAHPAYLRDPKPIFEATKHDRVNVVRLLLDLGASPDVEDSEHQRPLHVAAYYNAPNVARLLLARGAMPDPVHAAYNNTPLGAATYSQHPERIEVLARVSSDIWELAYGAHKQRLQEVLRGNPVLAKTASGGHTLLMWLPPNDEQRAIEVAALLLANGADASVVNKEGETAADRAAQLGMFELEALLRSASAA